MSVKPAAHILHYCIARVTEVRDRYYHEIIIRRSGISFLILFLVFLLSVFLESLNNFSSHVRTVFAQIFFVLGVTAMVMSIVVPLLRKHGILPGLSRKEAAALIGKHFPSIADRLENSIELALLMQSHSPYPYSSELAEASLKEFHDELCKIDVRQAVPFSPLTSIGKQLSLVAVAAMVLFAIPGSPFGDAALRLIRFDTQFIPPHPFIITLLPGSVEIVKGESAQIIAEIVPTGTASARQDVPAQLSLSYHEQGVEAEETVALRPDSTGKFRHTFSSMTKTMFYHARAANVTSEEFSLTVLERPFIRTMSVTIIPPAYSKLPVQRLEENIGDIMALSGSRIEWNIGANKEIRQGAVVFRDGDDIPLRKKGNGLHAAWVAKGTSSYYVELEDQDGLMNTDPITYKITIIPDHEPVVAVLFPGRNIDIADNTAVPLQIRAEDDFGISSMKIVSQLVQSKWEQTNIERIQEIPLPNPGEAQFTLDFEWKIEDLHLAPEDVVEYFIEVVDNDNITGPKTGRSNSYLLRLPSLEEVFADAEQAHDKSLSSLEESLRQAEELKKDLEELSRDMKTNKQLDWQKQKKAEEIVKQYEEIQKKMDEVNRTVQKMTEDLAKNNTLSSETMEKYLELQKTMQEMNTPEFRDAMKRMQDAMKNMNQQQLQQAMQQAQFSEEQFRQSIERTLNLLKRIQIEQKVDEMIKRSEQLQELQQEIQQKTSQLDPKDQKGAEELAQKQEDVARQLDQLQQDLDELRSKMEEFPKEMPLDQLAKADSAANDRSMEESMKQSASQIRSQQRSMAMQAQQKAGKGLQQMQQEMSELQEQLLTNQMQEVMDGLRKAMQDMLTLSQRQEDLKNRSRSLDPNSQQFRDVAQQQQNIQGDLANVANQLGELSQKSFAITPEMGKQVGRAMGNMQQAMTGIENRNGTTTSSFQAEAMASLNQASLLMQGAMNQMQQQGGQGGGSLMQQLRMMAQQQQSINMQSQQMMQGDGMSQQQLQEMGRIAKQQEAVQKSLEQLQKEAQRSSEREQIKGDLKKISDEMKEVVSKLEQQQLDPNTLQQQERILSRLLQAQSSLRERDFEEKRKAVSGNAPVRIGPRDIQKIEQDHRPAFDLQRAVEAGYSKEYLDYIQKYFDSLQKLNKDR